MKYLMLWLLAVSGSLVAAEIDLRRGAEAARSQAETALASERTRIGDERAAKAALLSEAVRTLGETRHQAQTMQAEAEHLRHDLDNLRLANATAEMQVRQQLTRAAAVLHLDLPDNNLGERAQVVATALLSAPDALQAQAQVRLAEEAVHDRSGTTVTIPVLRIATARALACGDSPATRGTLIAQPAQGDQTELWLVAGPPLSPTLEAALADPTRVVVDIQGSWAAKAPPVHRSLAEWIRGGRLFIWPIMAVGVLGLILATMRSVALSRLPLLRERIDVVLAWIASGRLGTAPVNAASLHPVERILSVGVATFGQPRAEREAALDRAVLSEAPPLQRGLTLLLLLASIAPLLGLLGTVTGMIDLFSVIGAQGSGNARSLSGGISEALITTQAGMFVAVPLLVAHALLNRAAERRILVLEEAASGLLGAAAMESPAT